ncbi:hypothetical protein O181_064604 [Austropuccinia psidii MF-1]|uniref:Uncharacterized protein n=1 Tax=Austropuccinia psidii MF-1 TaxID=1389203 RepID=A0A9Q3I3P9_9BASI|nr:hypothetical protein [Austropuccinia psidii MF-1]
MTITPHEIGAFQRMSFFMKDLSIFTGDLAKMMTSNYSFNYSRARCWGRKPTTRSEAWKKDHFQGKPCSYDNLSLQTIANIQSGSPRATKDFNFKSFQCTGSQLGDEDQKIITKRQKHLHKSNIKDNLATNTAYSMALKPFVSDTGINRQSNFMYESGSLQNSSAPLPIATSIPTKKNFSREEYSINFDSQKINSKTIEKDKNTSTNTKTTISNVNRPLSCNQPDTNSNDIYNKEEQKVKLNTSRTSSSINKIEFETIDATDTENNEKRILNQIKNYIERKINDQPITTQIQISYALMNIITDIHNERDLYYYLNSNKPYNILTIHIESALIQESFHKNKLNTNKLKDLKQFHYSNNKKLSY